MKRLLVFLLMSVAFWLSPVKAEAQGAAFHDSVLQSFAGVPSATVRVCNEVLVWSSTTAYSTTNQVLYGDQIWQAVAGSTGVTPGTNAADWAQANCASLASIYSDRALTQSLSNPFQTTTAGNFTFFGGGGTAYTVQIVSPRSYAYTVSFTNGTVTQSGLDAAKPGSCTAPFFYQATDGNKTLYSCVAGVLIATGGTFSFNPATVTDPWIDGRSQVIDCTGVADSSAAFVTWILNSHKRKEVPGDCKIKIQASGGLGAVITGLEGLGSQNAGWIDIYGGDGAEVFGCGAGTGAVLNFNRSGYFHFHGFTVQPTDTTLCPGGSTFTRDIDWTNNGGGGVTSTKAEFGHLRLLTTGFPTGGTFYPTSPPIASAGNNVTFIRAYPSWTNLAAQQITATNFANGTLYTASVQAAIASATFDPNEVTTGQESIAIGKCTANCSNVFTPTVVVLATAPCTATPTDTWVTCTVNYTGVAGDVGSPIVVRFLNSSTVASGKFNQMLFDNVNCTNFTCSNPSFETLNYGASLSAGGFIQPGVATGWNWVNFPQFTGMQIGAVQGDPNLEGWNIHDVDIDGAFMYDSVGIHDIGCCSEHGVLTNVGMFNIYRGITGSMPVATITDLHGGGAEGANQYNAQVFGKPYGALIASNFSAVVSNLTWDGFGPLFNSAKDNNGNLLSTTNNVPVFINPQISGTVHAPGEYDIDISNVENAVFVGGAASNITGGALNNTENAFVGMSVFTGNGCCGDAYGLQTVELYPGGLNGATIKGAHVLMHGLVANGTATLGTTAISAGTCATVVTVSAPGVNTQQAAASGNLVDTITFSPTTAPSGAYTQGLRVDSYTTTDNVNFLVCNPTSGSLTPPAKTISWSVVR